jgi:excisionase family DNA binding protein
VERPQEEVGRAEGVNEIPDELLTIEDAARRLGVLAMDLRRLLQDKKLPAIQTESGQWRISAKALEEYVKGAKMAQADQAGEKGMALTISELHQLAAEARAVGFREIEVKEQPEPGIQARGYFFTATELASIVNAGFFVNGMFEAIVARRIKPAARKGE